MSFLKDGAQKVGSVSTIGQSASVKNGAEQLVKSFSEALQKEGHSEEVYDYVKAYEAKTAGGMHTKANEFMHTTNTGFGAELVPSMTQIPDFLDMAPRLQDSFVSKLTGYHGRNLNKQNELPIIGELGQHVLLNESTDGSIIGAFGNADGKMPTAKVSINMKKLGFRVNVTDEEVRYSSNIVDLVALVQQKLAVSSAQTIENMILNGDTVTAATGNVSSVDAALPASSALLVGDGLRKYALAGGAATSFDAGTLAFTDYVNALKLLGEHGADRDDIIWLFNRQTELASLSIPEFSQQYINGSMSTVMTGKLPKFLGSEVHVSRYFTQANATGNVSATPANNTKGAFLAMKKDAIQYGFNGDYTIEIFRSPGFGWQIMGYFYAGFATVPNTAIGVSPRIALGYNVTV